MTTSPERSASSTRLVGRQAELEQVREFLSAHGAGTQLLSIVGEAGLGKTALLTAAEAEATAAGWCVAWGRSWEAAQEEALWAFQQLALELKLMAPVPAANESRAAHLQKWIQALESQYGDERLLLLLDDLQWADESSILLTEWLCRQTRFRACRVIAAWRGPEVVSQTEHWQRLEALRRLGETLQLGGLSTDEVKRFLDQSGRKTARNSPEQIRTMTGGNPFFLRELLSAPNGGSSLAPTEGLRAYVAARLAPESQPHKQLLEAASALGRIFEQATLGALLSVEQSELERRLAGCERAGFLERYRHKSVHQGRWAFKHDLLRETIYEQLDPTERQCCHARVAKLLSSTGEDAVQLFEHTWRARSHPGALLQATLSAVEHHNSTLAYESCLSTFERFDQRAEEQSWTPQKLGDIARLALTAARAGMLGVELSRGQAVCRRALAWGRSAGDLDVMTSAALNYGHRAPFSVVDRKHVSLLRQVLDVAEATHRSSEQDGQPQNAQKALACSLKLRARLAAAVQPASNPEEARRMARRCLDTARKIGDEALLGEVLELSRGAFRPVDEVRLRRQHDLETLQAAQRRNAPLSELQAALRLAGEEMELGARDSAEALLNRAQELAQQLRLPAAQERLLRIRASLATLDGRIPEARKLLRASQALELYDSTDGGFPSRQLHQLWLARWWGDTAQLRAALQDSGAASSIFHASLRLWLGDPSSSSEFESICSRDYPADYPDLVLRPELVAAYGTAEQAQLVYRRLLPLASQYMVFAGVFALTDGSYQRHLGLLAQRAGDRLKARDHLEAAVQANLRIAQGPVLDLTRRQLRELVAADASAQTAGSAVSSLNTPPPRTGQGGAAQENPSTEHSATGLLPVLTQHGSGWQARYRQYEGLLEDSDGLRYLAWLLEHPGQETHVLELMALRKSAQTAEAQRSEPGLSAPAEVAASAAGLDARAFAQCRAELERLKEAELAAEELGATEEAVQLREQQVQLAEQLITLQRSRGPQGRSPAEKARVNVTQRIRKTIAKLKAMDSAMGHHLQTCVRTGRLCSYWPPPSSR